MRAGPVELWICLLLVLLILASYAQVRDHDFVSYDDPDYVSANPHLREGFTATSVAWALTAEYAGNWHPLTWISHMLDIQLFGLNPGPHHLMSVVFHAANALLLFLVLKRMTGMLGQSAFVAGLFALHPLHVESVAWVAERKDVLSTLFWMLTLWFYARYVERPGVKRYLMTLLSFALGLMAKPMLVTLPFVLLLLDFWPLGRTFSTKPATNAMAARAALPKSRDWNFAVFKLVREKLPFLILAVLSSVMTFHVQRGSGAVATVHALPLVSRIENALLSYLRYIAKMVWPADLTVFYPYSPRFLWWQVAAAGLLLLCVSLLVLRWSIRRPYLAVGWFWYVGTLAPVIGIVQVGIQAMADRYTYAPLVGLWMMIAWGVPEFFIARRNGWIALSTLAALVILACAVCTWKQVGYWKSSVGLFQHALEATANNFVAYNDLGSAIEKQGRAEEAIACYRKALRIKPDFVLAQSNLGAALGKQGKLQEGVAHLREALRLKPDHADAQNNLGIALALQGKNEEAMWHFLEAIRVKPDHANARYNLGRVLMEQGRLDEAIVQFSEVLQIDPSHAQARADLNSARQRQRQSASQPR